MKTVILCGGRGTRLDHHGALLPKALFRIGDDPLIVHLFRIYRHFGITDFALCLGYLAPEFEKFFGKSAQIPGPEISSHIGRGPTERTESITVDLFDTGLDTNTGGRLKLLRETLKGDSTFCVTYGDGLADVDLDALINYHKNHGRIATLTAVNPMSNFGLIDIDDSGSVVSFREKPKLSEWINGGFFVFETAIFDYLGENCVLEREPIEKLAADGELMAYRHNGFWRCMDTFKDSVELNEIWEKRRSLEGLVTVRYEFHLVG